MFCVICWPGVLYIQLFVKLFRGREGEMLVGGGVHVDECFWIDVQML